MSTTLPTTSNIWPPVEVPEGTEVVNIADLIAAYQALKDRTDRLDEALRGGTGGAYTMQVPLMNYAPFTGDAADWDFKGPTEGSIVNGFSLQQINANTPICWVPLPKLVLGTVITNVFVNHVGENHGAVPATPPEVRLLRQENNTNSAITIATASRVAGSGAIFDTPGAITLTPNHVVDTGAYYIQITGEGGANSEANGSAFTSIALGIGGDTP